VFFGKERIETGRDSREEKKASPIGRTAPVEGERNCSKLAYRIGPISPRPNAELSGEIKNMLRFQGWGAERTRAGTKRGESREWVIISN